MKYYTTENRLTEDGSYSARVLVEKTYTENELVNKMLLKRNIVSKPDLRGVISALKEASGASKNPPQFAALASDVSFKPSLTCFQPVKLISNVAGQTIAMPVKTNTSGDFASLSATDGYVELAKDQTEFPAGSPTLLRRWIVD